MQPEVVANERAEECSLLALNSCPVHKFDIGLDVFGIMNALAHTLCLSETVELGELSKV